MIIEASVSSAGWLCFFIFVFGFHSISSWSISLFVLFAMKWVSLLECFCCFWGLLYLSYLFWNKTGFVMVEYWFGFWFVVRAFPRLCSIHIGVINLITCILSRVWVVVVDRDLAICVHDRSNINGITLIMAIYFNFVQKVELYHSESWLLQVEILTTRICSRWHKRFFNHYRSCIKQEEFWLWLMGQIRCLAPLNQTQEFIKPVEFLQQNGNWHDLYSLAFFVSLTIDGVIMDLFISGSIAQQSNLKTFLCGF